MGDSKIGGVREIGSKKGGYRKFLNKLPRSNRPPPKNSFLQISPRGLIRGFTVKEGGWKG